MAIISPATSRHPRTIPQRGAREERSARHGVNADGPAELKAPYLPPAPENSLHPPGDSLGSITLKNCPFNLLQDSKRLILWLSAQALAHVCFTGLLPMLPDSQPTSCTSVFWSVSLTCYHSNHNGRKGHASEMRHWHKPGHRGQRVWLAKKKSVKTLKHCVFFSGCYLFNLQNKTKASASNHHDICIN